MHTTTQDTLTFGTGTHQPRHSTATAVAHGQLTQSLVRASLQHAVHECVRTIMIYEHTTVDSQATSYCACSAKLALQHPCSPYYFHMLNSWGKSCNIVAPFLQEAPLEQRHTPGSTLSWRNTVSLDVPGLDCESGDGAQLLLLCELFYSSSAVEPAAMNAQAHSPTLRSAFGCWQLRRAAAQPEFVRVAWAFLDLSHPDTRARMTAMLQDGKHLPLQLHMYRCASRNRKVHMLLCLPHCNNRQGPAMSLRCLQVCDSKRAIVLYRCLFKA